MLDIWTIAGLLAKAAMYVGMLTAGGLVIVHCAFASHVRDVASSMRSMALFCAILGAVAAFASFTLRGAALTGGASGLTDPEILGLLWQTPAGSALLYRLSGLGILCLGLLVGGVGWTVALFGTGLLLWSFSIIGHVADDTAIWIELVLFLHVIVASFWIGVLMPLSRLSKRPETVAAAGDLGHKFGQIAFGAIPLLVVAGLLLSWRLVGSWSALFATGYGLMLVAKVLLVAGLLGLGALNKYRFVPRLLADEPGAGDIFRRVLGIEWAVFFLVFGATAFLTAFFALPGG
ncbi:copper resistance D family protein [Roseovarius aestuariivivens]|uniref:copper resistance D family protein n=1 Tax=Roseovarius aestuariivivens TaxID=1888910 RepID=UPI0010800DB6|nr:CopD family protein [Roseovarius aestuariivivens]